MRAIPTVIVLRRCFVERVDRNVNVPEHPATAFSVQWRRIHTLRPLVRTVRPPIKSCCVAGRGAWDRLTVVVVDGGTVGGAVVDVVGGGAGTVVVVVVVVVDVVGGGAGGDAVVNVTSAPRVVPRGLVATRR